MLEQPVIINVTQKNFSKNFIKFFSAKYRKFFQSGFFPRKNIKNFIKENILRLGLLSIRTFLILMLESSFFFEKI